MDVSGKKGENERDDLHTQYGRNLLPRFDRSRTTLLEVIGVFDSGFGGLTVWGSLVERLPRYDFLYLADSARAPYGARSPEVVHRFTLQAVEWLFEQGCPLVILACNTASARALRTIQQQHLPKHRPDRRVLGMVRPSVEALANLPVGSLPGLTPPSETSGTVAVLATETTIGSDSFGIELRKFAPHLELIQQACPMLAPLVEAGELEGEGTKWFLHKYLDPVIAKSPSRILLGCTHYPLLLPGIRAIVPDRIEVLSQGPLVADRLADWLVRHPEMERRLTQNGTRHFATTDSADWFSSFAARFLGAHIEARQVLLEGNAKGLWET
ncbi:MAG: glutamate racemase [Fibrobacterota bacterium]|nr:MAG: glutamate racemase [Fibrobacterota bacterium]